MLKHEEDLILYHGSYCEVSKPDLTRCAKYKDFGQGFYLTTSEEQAQRFSRTSLRKAIANGIVDRQQESMAQSEAKEPYSCASAFSFRRD